jgi:hypothetical protein
MALTNGISESDSSYVEENQSDSNKHAVFLDKIKEISQVKARMIFIRLPIVIIELVEKKLCATFSQFLYNRFMTILATQSHI